MTLISRLAMQNMEYKQYIPFPQSTIFQVKSLNHSFWCIMSAKKSKEIQPGVKKKRKSYRLRRYLPLSNLFTSHFLFILKVVCILYCLISKILKKPLAFLYWWDKIKYFLIFCTNWPLTLINYLIRQIWNSQTKYS